MASDDSDAIEAVIIPPVRDLGDGFQVRRALPSAKRRMVGPFIFFDQMGPTAFRSGEGLDVRPHPHIGLATITYLLDGEIMHRDSVGSVQPIRPGEVNWMTAGSGIVHSERTAPELRAGGHSLFGLQTWVALPKALEETSPSFAHHKADAMPTMFDGGMQLTVIAGTSDGLTSPVKALSDIIYADLRLANGTRYPLRADHVERAAYVISGTLHVEGAGSFGPDQLVIFKPGAELVLRGEGATRVMIAGGEPFPEQRYIYWNFVSSSEERIEQAKADWREQRFDAVPDEDEFIPLPPDPKPVRYP